MDATELPSANAARQLARWILAQEIEADAAPLDAAERACEKLSKAFAQIVTSAGAERLLARASYLASVEFPSLAGLKVGTAGDGACIGELRQRLAGEQPAETTEVIVEVLRHAIGLMESFIGTNLVLSRLRATWPDLPANRPASEAEEMP